MPEHRLSQHAALDIAALAHQLFGAVGMADRFHILMDDRVFVEVGSVLVRRRTDHLHTARMRLMIGLGALEAGQERVVDIDAAA